MDESRFDHLVRALAKAGTRRGLLSLLAMVPLLGGFFALFDDADAKGRRKRRKKRHKHGKGNGRHRNRKCQPKSRAKICAGTCGLVKNKQTCQKKVNCGPCVACSAAQPCPSGCCAGDRTCRPGTAPQACGREGTTCQVCAGTELCHQGTCQPCDVCAEGCPHTSVQQAIAHADAGDTIRICAGTYQEGEILIAASLTLIGAGDGENGTILDGQGQHRVLAVAAGTTVDLQGLRLTGGNTNNNGGGIFNEGQVTLTDCTVIANASQDGGGIVNDRGKMTLTGCTVIDNASQDGGGIINDRGGEMTLTDCTVRGNTANAWGGGIINSGGTLTLIDSTVSGNTVGGNPATDKGGGIINLGGILTLTDSTVSDNTAGAGGGLYNVGTLTLTNSTVSDNTANEAGGGLSNLGILTLTNSTVSGNTAGNDGGGILNAPNGTVNLEGDSQVCENTVDGQPSNCVGFSDPAGACKVTCSG